MVILAHEIMNSLTLIVSASHLRLHFFIIYSLVRSLKLRIEEFRGSFFGLLVEEFSGIINF